MKKPIVGQTVWLKAINNAARRGNKIVEAKVTKVGREYFYAISLGSRSEHKFYIESGNVFSNASPDWQAYESEQEILDSFEAGELLTKIRKYFAYGSNCTIEQLRAIDNILNQKQCIK